MTTTTRRNAAKRPAAKAKNSARTISAKKTGRKTTHKPKWRHWLQAQWQALQAFARQEPESMWFLGVMALGLVLRFCRPDWYVDRQFHPDERWIFGVVSQLSYPQEPQALQYGTFPMYLLSAIKDLAATLASGFGHFDANRFVVVAGRMLSGCFDLGTMVFTYFIGRRLEPGALGRKIGLLASALLALTVLNIQMAHFFVVDVPLATLATGTLYASLGIAQAKGRREYLLAGILLGLAAATKTSFAPLALAVGVAHLIGLSRVRVLARRQCWHDLGLAVAASLVTFFVAMPYAILDWDKFWSNQNEQRRILITGEADVPYNRQYLHTTPYLYYFKNLIQYGMGSWLGWASLLAFLTYPVLGAVRAWQRISHKRFRLLLEDIQRHSGLLVILSYALPYFFIIGGAFAKFNRYLLPLTPFLCLLAACALLQLRVAAPRHWLKKAAAWGMGAVLAGAALWSLAFVSIYGQEHPWIAASRWLEKNLQTYTQDQAGAHLTTILNEEWGDDLPTYVAGVQPKNFRINKFAVQEPDTERKRAVILSMLQQNDVVAIADTRAHAVYRRLADRYPINAAYYELLFAGQLGFTLAAEFKNYPHLFGLEFPDDQADESFTLYDHPHVYLFRRQTPPLSPVELARRLDTRVAEIKAHAVRPVSRPPASLPARAAAPALPKVINANIGEPSVKPHFILGQLNSFTAVLAWLFLLELIGCLSIPLCLSLFPHLPDSGTALAKIIGTLVLAWVTWMLVCLGVANHQQGTTAMVLLVLGAASGVWAMQRRTEIHEFITRQGKYWLLGELVFLFTFVGYVLTKLYNPDIHNPWGQGYNGGGEPMGISFFSSAYYSLHFPPYDPWLSGYHINYYYFGQVILGILAKVIGVPPEWSYQICIAMLLALTMTGVYGLGLGLTGKRRWGLAAAVAAGMAGNLHTFFYMLEPFTRDMNWNEILASLARTWSDTWVHMGRFEFIWNPTRLIKGTINEMPWFSFLYGDLHAHMIAIPYSLPIIGWGLNVLMPANRKTVLLPEAPGRTGSERGLTFFVTALNLGALSAINTWNFPPYALLVLGVLAAKNWQEYKGRGIPWKSLGLAGLGWLRLVAGGLLLMFFFHKYFIPQSTSLALVNPAVRTQVKELLEFFGLVIFVLSTYCAFQLLPEFRAFLSGLGWKPGSRKPWQGKLLQSSQAMWDQHPVAVYVLLSVLAGLVLLMLFGQYVLVVLLLLLAAAVYVLASRPLSPQLRLTMLLAVIGVGIVLGCELVHIRDFMGVGGDMSRMNTVFKFYMVAWIYFALVLASLLAQIFSGKKEENKLWRKALEKNGAWRTAGMALALWAVWALSDYFQEQGLGPWLVLALALVILALPWIWAAKPEQRELRRAWIAALGAMAVIVLLYPPVSLYNRMRLCSEFKHPTLNGYAYLDRLLPGEVKALAWIREHVNPTDIVLEAPGYRGYNCFDTRIPIFTGHPTLIGWIGQEEQMRYQPALTAGHTQDAETIYKTLDIPLAQRLMEEYQIQYVLVGLNEKQAFPGPGLQKFRAFMEPVFQQDDAIIYKQRKP